MQTFCLIKQWKKHAKVPAIILDLNKLAAVRHQIFRIITNTANVSPGDKIFTEELDDVRRWTETIQY